MKTIGAILVGLLALLAPLIKWWLNSRSIKVKNRKEAYEKAENKIKNDEDTSDLQSDIDDLVNGL